MNKAFVKSWVVGLLLVLSVGAASWYVYARSSAEKNRAGAPGAPAAAGEKPEKPKGVPVVAVSVKARNVPIYLDGLGTVKAFESVTVRSQIDGQIARILFKEGQDVKKGDPLFELDSRLYTAQVEQAQAKLKQDQARTKQDMARVEQDRAKEVQDEAKKKQNQAELKVAEAKKAQDNATLANARVTLKRNEDSMISKAVSEQAVQDQRSLVEQLTAQVLGDDAAIQSALAAIQADDAAILGDRASIQANEALVNADRAAEQSDEASIRYAETYLSYTKIASPIDGRTGLKLADVGNLVRANSNEVTGLVMVTRLKPISVLFSLPQQDFVAINERMSKGELEVIAVENDGKTEIERGKLELIDNQIDTTTGTLKLKANFPNEKMRLWPGGFVNVRLLVNTRENALTVPAPVVQNGPDGTFVYVVNADQTVEVRVVKVALIQDGRAVIEGEIKVDDLVVLSGHDRLKNGENVIVSKPKSNKPESAPATKTPAEANAKNPPIEKEKAGGAK